jgi:hypothetical protein
MIDKPTLFILGAGASQPYGYPTGEKLRTDIINNYGNYYRKLKDVSQKDVPNVPHTYREIQAFVQIFSNSSITSIDKFLSLNPAAAAYGKIGITLSILNSEKESQFREKANPDEDWYTYLFNRMMEGLKKPENYKEFSKNKVAFITFNYDRSLEYILYDSFYHSFYQSRNDIKNNIEEFVPFPIIHVYGTVAKFNTLDWPKHDYNNDYYDNYLLIENLSKGIKVIGEERVGESVKDEVKKLLPAYKRIFFLGFGYAQENLDAIDLIQNIDAKWKIYGTAKGMTPKEIRSIKNRLPIKKNTLGEGAYATIEDMNCYRLLREYL